MIRQYATRQPITGAWKVDWQHPIARKLKRVAIATPGGFVELRQGGQLALSATHGSLLPYGEIYQGYLVCTVNGRGSDLNVSFGTDAQIGWDVSKNFFAFIGAYRDSTSSEADEETLLSNWDNVDRRILIRYDSQTSRFEFFTGAPATAGNPAGASMGDTNHHWLAFREDGVNKAIWIDGTKNATGTTAGTMEASTNPLLLGQSPHNAGASGDNWGGGISLCYLSDEYISDSQVAQLTANPWLFFYREIPVYIPAAAPTGATPHSPFGICLHGPFAGPIG